MKCPRCGGMKVECVKSRYKVALPFSMFCEKCCLTAPAAKSRAGAKKNWEIFIATSKRFFKPNKETQP